MLALVHEVLGALDDLQPQHKMAAFFDTYSGCSSAQARHVQRCSAQCNACSQQSGVTSSAWQRVRTAQELLGALEDCCSLLTCRICVAVLRLKVLRTLCISFFGTRSHVSQNFAGQCLTLSRALAPLRSAIQNARTTWQVRSWPSASATLKYLHSAQWQLEPALQAGPAYMAAQQSWQKAAPFAIESRNTLQEHCLEQSTTAAAWLTGDWRPSRAPK